MNAITAKNITKSFKGKETQTTVFSDLDFVVEKGIFTSLQGVSGVGKSTLLHILGSIDKPDVGEIIFHKDDENIELHKLDDKSLSKLRNQNIGFIFQFHHLLPEFSAIENIMMPALISGMNFKVAEKQASDLMELVGISHRKKNKPQELSGGEQQRAAIARALINKPFIVLADEPTGNLDEKNSESVLKLLDQLKKEFSLTFLVATHSKDVAEIADKKLMMTQGKIEVI
jgi:lipoprotein-releasing system ATP-binding protein